MNIDFIPFKIGEKYEDLKSDLEIEDSAPNYIIYRYTKGDIQEFEGYKVTDVFLYFNLNTLFQVEMYLEQGKSVFNEFHKVNNGTSIRGKIEKKTKLIELTYCKDKIWRDL